MAGAKLKVDFFSTLEQAKELARNTEVDDLAVRCTVDDVAMALRMMQTVIAAPRDKLKIQLPPYSAKLIGQLAAKSQQRRLELVDNSQMLKTSYVFEKGTLVITAEVPGGRKKVLGASSSPEVFTVIFDAMELGLRSITALPSKITIKTRPSLTEREHNDRLAKIAQHFGATLG
jgi:hypothetical protein